MKWNKNRFVLSVPFLIAAVALLYIITEAFSTQQTVLTAMVETAEIDVSSKLPGRLDSVLVTEGQQVKKGQVLAILQSREIDAKVEQARGSMEAARSMMEMAKNGARPEEKRAVKNLYSQAVAQFDLAEKTWKRVQSVFADSVIATQEKDEVEFKYKAAKEQMEAARAKYDMVQNGARNEEIEAATALFHSARYLYNESLVYQEECRLISPIDGEVFSKASDRGEMVAAGYPVFTLIDPSDTWLVLNIREDLMPGLKKDSIVKGVIPALGTESYEFKIVYIAAMADFASWRATNQKGDFDLKTFEIHLRPVTKMEGLRAGMSARLEI